MSGAFNYPAASIQAGENNIMGWDGARAGGLAEGHYYRVRFSRAFRNHTGGAYILTWASESPALNGSSAGSVALNASKGAGPLQCRFVNLSKAGSGRAANLVGIRVTDRHELEAVFYIDDNGTATRATNLVFTATGSGNAASVQIRQLSGLAEAEAHLSLQESATRAASS
jgi:hypothetical protein